MFILISLFVLGITIISAWFLVILMAVLFNIPEIIGGFIMATAWIAMVFLILFCAWLALQVLKVVLKWLGGLVSGLTSSIWWLICWALVKRKEEEALVKNPKRVRFEDRRRRRKS